MPELQYQYDWLSAQMQNRIGGNKNIKYPVWAWYIYTEKRKKPDLRKVRYTFGSKGQKCVCMELDIPDEEVVLSDFHSWSLILNDSLISDTEEEDSQIEKYYESLPDDEKDAYKLRNWERVFDTSMLDNDWLGRGEYVQATFWELKREAIIRTYEFVCG